MAPPKTHHFATIDDTTIHYFEIGDPSLPTLLLLHGFPSSSTQYRNFAPLLADKYHIIAPDLPGFGLTKTPSDYVFTFDNLAKTISGLLHLLNISKYAVYIFDYGAPVGLRLALEAPDSVKAIISQNGNAYEEGLEPAFWAPIKKLWRTENSREARDWLRNNYLTLAATEMQYTAGFPKEDLKLVDRSQWNLDFTQNQEGRGNQERQIDLFYNYRTNLSLYPKVHAYFREKQPPVLAIWGKGDPIFVPPGAEAFKKHLKNAQVQFVDAGHFALETKGGKIAEAVLKFLGGVSF
ncbi:hypothetical protein B0A48_17551 [Cryoendolithus antarcticus]|uniref:AB hydrolase-1 domain-containing protein n=1 Tax=Cryoendolithus antarcticus TaxID=1507870 RepID=A0A1V8SAW2_9PEZI|nr:hypothetical protein B0A48_17551 [Cryoendolithus antarcticus]